MVVVAAWEGNEVAEKGAEEGGDKKGDECGLAQDAGYEGTSGVDVGEVVGEGEADEDAVRNARNGIPDCRAKGDLGPGFRVSAEEFGEANVDFVDDVRSHQIEVHFA